MIEMMIEFRVGQKIKFTAERQKYTVQACSEWIAICTKPFNLKHTVLYTIVNRFQNIRGTENLVFGSGAETKEQCEEMLQRLTSHETDISRRNFTELDIESYD